MTNTPEKKAARPGTQMRLPEDMLARIEEVRRDLESRDPAGRRMTTADAVRFMLREYLRLSGRAGGA